MIADEMIFLLIKLADEKKSTSMQKKYFQYITEQLSGILPSIVWNALRRQ
jgi:hypothetical protein